ncbi:monooxygenase [Nitriliruptoraceae bacterium ZYF776]|nr:monooxygenase [Profundirhabdus halotolerans]
MSEHPDVVIVGAGPAGLGVGAALARLGVTATIVDRDEVGASFRRWPEGTRLLTPSFTGNQFGLPDLNAITPDTSPALTLLEEHPTGARYADYLDVVVKLADLRVRDGVEVVDVTGDGDDERLRVHVRGGPDLHPRKVVWAAGEARYPRRDGFPGADACVPTIEVRRWDAHPGDDVVVVGGYESGIDAACHLVARGRRVTVVDPGAPWEVVDADPSRTLAPVTHGRLRHAVATGQLTLVGDEGVAAVRAATYGFEVVGTDGSRWTSDGPPLLATGFRGSLELVRDRFAWDDDGHVVVTEEADESTVLPGLYLAGPSLAHRGAIFCFVYKFRQRFALVAGAIAADLGVDPAPLLAEYDEHNFLLDDLSCCDDCAC